MEGDVFSYFLAIGAGLSLGLSIGLVPGYLFLNWMKRRGNHDIKTTKNRSRA